MLALMNFWVLYVSAMIEQFDFKVTNARESEALVLQVFGSY